MPIIPEALIIFSLLFGINEFKVFIAVSLTPYPFQKTEPSTGRNAVI